MDINIGGLPLKPAPGLVDHDSGMRQGKALARSTAGQYDCAHTGSLAHADRADIRPNKLHSVIDGHASIHRTAR